jgi:ABC-type uncharacterized transport system substrate-binding protein
MKIFFTSLLIFATACFNLAYADNDNSQVIKIGVVAPIKHQAMDKIIKGFITQVNKTYKNKVHVEVQNAMGDVNLLRSILQKFKLVNYDVIVPIGVVATNMSAALIKDKVIIALAADSSEGKSKSCLVHSVLDEIDNKKILHFVKVSYPKINNVMLVYSNTDKVLTQAKDFIVQADKLNIKIIPVMVNTVTDLANNVSSIVSSHHPNAIVILKDTTVVSGVSFLAHISQTNQIPFIVSDEGSVQAGAGIGLGVKEEQIGVEGALLLKNVLDASDMCDIADKKMDKLTLFINKNNLFGISVLKLQIIAQQMQYSLGII